MEHLMNEWLGRLVRYNRWANGKMLSHVQTLPPDVFARSVQSVFPSVKDAYRHIAVVDALWLDRMKGESANARVVHLAENAEELASVLEHIGQQLEELAASLEPDDTFEYRNSRGERFEDTFATALQHVVNHGTYHRGNVTAMLRQLGEAGVSTDFIFYVRETGDQQMERER